MRWLVRRIGIAVLVMWAIASVVFLSVLLAGTSAATAFHRSLLTEYAANFARLFTGDLGHSLQDGRSVAGEIAARLANTLELLGLATVLAMLGGVSGGALAAMDRRGMLDAPASSLATFALAMPVFVVGVLFSLLFGETADQVLIPAIALALGLSAAMFLTTRDAVLDLIQRDYVRTAWAKGVGPWRILVHHVLRNAPIPVTTGLAMYLGTLFGGAVLIEYIFGRPGLGTLLVEAVKARDLPMVQGIVLVFSVLFVGLNLAIDLIRAVLDPRLRTA